MKLPSFRPALSGLGFGIMLILALGVEIPRAITAFLLVVALAALLYGLAPFVLWLRGWLSARWAAFMRPWRVTAPGVYKAQTDGDSSLAGLLGPSASQESDTSSAGVEDAFGPPGFLGIPVSAEFHLRTTEPTQDRDGFWHVSLVAQNEGHGAVFRAEVIRLTHLVPSNQKVPWDLRWSEVEERELLLARGESQRLDLLIYKDMGFHWVALTEEHWGMCQADGKPGFALVRLIRTEPGAYRDQWVRLTHADGGAMPGLSVVSRPDPEPHW